MFGHFHRKYYFCNMKERINWVDWAKAWCMTVVVFDHTPHDGSHFLLQYLAGTNLASFFFVSGFLRGNSKAAVKPISKYIYSLLIPYLIYNAIYYPYWLADFVVKHHGNISVTDCIKPIAGTFLFQLNTSFSAELNGVTWFLLALFLMHWITGLIQSLRHRNSIIILLSLAAMTLYGMNKYYHYAPNLTFNGFVRSLCFFFLGYVIGQKKLLKSPNPNKDLPIGILALTFSLAIFYWHINETGFPQHIILYYTASFLAIPGCICLCRVLNQQRLKLVTCISTGTMIIFGLHRMLMGCIDYGLEKILSLENIVYSIPKAILLTVAIVLILIPAIIVARKHAPILLGKRNSDT